MIVNGVYARKAGIPQVEVCRLEGSRSGHSQGAARAHHAVIIIGGILSVPPPATEARHVVACVYSIIYGFIRRTMNTKHVWECFRDAVHGTTNCMIVVVFCRYLRHPCHELQPLKVVLAASQGLPRQPLPDPDIHQHHPLHSRYVHRFQRCDAHARAYLHPPIAAYGFDPIYFAMVCILTLEHGRQVSPSRPAHVHLPQALPTPRSKVVRNIFKFITVNYIVTLLVIFIPRLSPGFLSDVTGNKSGIPERLLCDHKKFRRNPKMKELIALVLALVMCFALCPAASPLPLQQRKLPAEPASRRCS